MVKEIDFGQLGDLINSGAELIDVREEEEALQGVIEGSKSWPLSTLALRKKEISQEKSTIFYCRSGLRSLKAAEIAEQWTSQPLFSLRGGFLEFSKQRPNLFKQASQDSQAVSSSP